MKTISLFLFVSVFSFNSYGSGQYITTGLVETAIRNAIGDQNAGVGGKATSCLLCHNSTGGGPGNINQSFGFDFQLTARDLGFGAGSNLSVAQLENIFQDTDFQNEDSDNDDDSNIEEWRADSDPASDVNGSTSGSGGDSGGCGMITAGGKPPKGPGPYLLLLPLFALLFPRWRTTRN